MNDYKLNGIGKITGGDYEKIEIDGIAKIQSNITFNEMYISGIVNIDGETKGSIIEADGIINFKGDVNSSKFNISGLIKAMSIKCESLIGTLSGVHAKQIYSDKVDLKFKRNRGLSKKFVLDGIYGEEIKLTNKKNKIRRIQIKEIIADNIKLEGINVGVIQGKNIELIDCKVNEVIYNNSLINTNSKINKEVKN